MKEKRNKQILKISKKLTENFERKIEVFPKNWKQIKMWLVNFAYYLVQNMAENKKLVLMLIAELYKLRVITKENLLEILEKVEILEKEKK